MFNTPPNDSYVKLNSALKSANITYDELQSMSIDDICKSNYDDNVKLILIEAINRKRLITHKPNKTKKNEIQL